MSDARPATAVAVDDLDLASCLLLATRDGRWTELGAVNAEDAPPGELYRELRGGCLGLRPCGALVDVAPGGLKTLVLDAPVLAAPAADGEVLDRYPSGTEVFVIGNARVAGYLYVSPCNACRRGFVEAGWLRN